MEERGKKRWRIKLRVEVSRGHNNHWPCHKSLVRPRITQYSLVGYIWLAQQTTTTDTTILQFLLKERGLDEKMNGEERKGAERSLGPEEECRERMSPF